MGVIITSHRNIIFWVICAALVSLLFFVCGYMLGKSSVVDPNARIAMILPVEDLELIEDVGEQGQDTDKVHNSKASQQDAEPLHQIQAEKKEQVNDKEKINVKKKPAQPVAKKKEDQKSQSKAQQRKTENLNGQKSSVAESLKKDIPKKGAAEKVVAKKNLEMTLTQQAEKPVGALYSIQVEAFGVQRNADKFLIKIREKYSSAHIFENKEKKRLPLAVRIGYFKSYRKALEAAKVFEAKEKRSAMVVKIGK